MRSAVENKVYESKPLIRAGVEQAARAEVTQQVTEQIKATLGVTDTSDIMIQEKIAATFQEQMASNIEMMLPVDNTFFLNSLYLSLNSFLNIFSNLT